MTQSTDDLVNCAESLKAPLIAECSCGAGQSCSYCTWHDTIERLQADLAARDKTIETLRAMLGTKIDAAHAAGRATIEAARSEGGKP